MSAISIRNAKSTEHRRLMRHMIKWLIEHKIGRKIHLDITVFFSNLKQTERCVGMCEWMDDAGRPRKFHIYIDNQQSLREQLRTISHEMVHVKQYVRNELHDYVWNFDRVRWKNDVLDLNDIRYRDQPWEKEAYALQTKWLREYLKATKTKARK